MSEITPTPEKIKLINVCIKDFEMNFPTANRRTKFDLLMQLQELDIEMLQLLVTQIKVQNGV